MTTPPDAGPGYPPIPPNPSPDAGRGTRRSHRRDSDAFGWSARAADCPRSIGDFAAGVAAAFREVA